MPNGYANDRRSTAPARRISAAVYFGCLMFHSLARQNHTLGYDPYRAAT